MSVYSPISDGLSRRRRIPHMLKHSLRGLIVGVGDCLPDCPEHRIVFGLQAGVGLFGRQLSNGLTSEQATCAAPPARIFSITIRLISVSARAPPVARRNMRRR